MEDKIQIRMAVPEDVDELLAIYVPYVKNTVITFEYEVPTREDFQNRIETILKRYPYLVAVMDGKIIGYAYASPYKTRAAYQWNVETSIYVAMNEQAKGVGSLLYAKLFSILRKQGVRNAYACISLPNEQSERIHSKFGFSLAGRFHDSGYKFGKWCDIGWFACSLAGKEEEPLPVIPITELISPLE